MTQTIIVADDHPLFRAALKQAVNQAVPDAETVEVDSIKALQAAVESHPDADLILLDLNMPGAHGFSGLVFMRGQYPGLPVVVVSGSEDLQVMRRSIDYGASGFIPKSHISQCCGAPPIPIPIPIHTSPSGQAAKQHIIMQHYNKPIY